jgi:hypothetical protein
MRQLGGVVVLLVGCVAPSVPPSVSETRQAIGEMKNGFPSPWERGLLMAANRARSDPATVKGPSSALYPAHAPLGWDYDLSRGARFHATTLEFGHAPLMHSSPCTLNSDVGTSGCDGKPSCACQGGTTCNTCGMNCTPGTDPFVRVGYFYRGFPSGEIAAAGTGDPFDTMDLWVDEPAGADGHRAIVNSDSGVVGFGHAQGAPDACWGTFDVGDFGSDRPAVPKIASAAASGTKIYATWSDPVGGAPRSLSAVVDGKCTAMTRELGDDKLNATWVASFAGSGCHTVYILGADAAGNRATFPTTTAFTVGCPDDERPQPPPDCDPTFVPAAPDMARPPSTEPQPSPDPGMPYNQPPPVTVESGCSAAPGIPLDGAWILLFVAAVRRLTRRR